MTKPTITVELTLHPEARDGQQNAWKIELKDPHGELLMTETGSTASACLDRASDYMACCGKVAHTYVVPPLAVTMAER